MNLLIVLRTLRSRASLRYTHAQTWSVTIVVRTPQTWEPHYRTEDTQIGSLIIVLTPHSDLAASLLYSGLTGPDLEPHYRTRDSWTWNLTIVLRTLRSGASLLYSPNPDLEPHYCTQDTWTWNLIIVQLSYSQIGRLTIVLPTPRPGNLLSYSGHVDLERHYCTQDNQT